MVETRQENCDRRAGSWQHGLALAGLLALLSTLGGSGCLSAKWKQKLLADCPPYQEEVAFSNFQSVKAPAKKKKFGLEKGALARLGKSKYLDKMFDGIKEDFEESGVKLKEIARGFEAQGIKLEKVVGPDGKTKELRVRLDGTIGFELGSARLTKIAAKLVAKIGKALQAYKETRAKLGGHVDCCASRRYSLDLSQRRSDAAKNALINKHGVAAARIIESIGYADDRMLIPVRRLEPRNRRVEIIIVPN